MRATSGASAAGSATDPATGPALLARRPEIVPITATILTWGILAWSTSPAGWTEWRGTGPFVAAHPEHGGIFTATGLAMITLMTLAMMAPLAVPGVRTVAFTSLWWRAGRAVLWFFGAFGLTWAVMAIVLAPFAAALGGALGSPATAAGVLLLACAVAEFDPRRGDLSRSCDRPMRLRAIGSDADVDCVRFGALTACRGVRLCALPMIAMLALPSSLLVMALVTGLSVTDRITLGRRRLVIAAGYAVLGAVLLI